LSIIANESEEHFAKSADVTLASAETSLSRFCVFRLDIEARNAGGLLSAHCSPIQWFAAIARGCRNFLIVESN
jgi:hypothetical protein